MQSIQIKNLRSLEDTGRLPIRPITLLVGKNSSGKSTFLRSFPLLRQSSEARTTGPILWYGRFVDYGGYRNALRAGAEDESISFTFSFTLNQESSGRNNREYWYNRIESSPILESIDFTVTIELWGDEPPNDTRTKAIELEFSGHRVRLEFDAHGMVKSYFVNSLDVRSLGGHFSVMPGNFVPTLFAKTESGRSRSLTLDHENRRISQAFVDLLRPYFHHRTREETVAHLLNLRGIGSSERMLADLASITVGGKSWRKFVDGLNPDDARFQRHAI